MIIEPTTLTARGSLVDLSEVNILLNLVKDSSTNVRLNILDTLTHLPLPEQGWPQVVKLIRQELHEARTFKDKTALLGIGSWVSYLFDAENEVRRIEADSKARKELLDAVKSIQYQYTIREDYDREWAASQAPGFVLFSESELLTRKSQLQSEVSIAASTLSNWWNNESTLDIAIEDPVLITLLFELAAEEDYYKVDLINNLLSHLERLENFRPDLNGLFEEYLRCVKGRSKEWSSYYGEPLDRWFLWYRDDEDPYSWRSWQIAWTVSRGGLKGLISALAIHLTANDETRQLAALALIADSADYVLQRSAALFGGGMRPSRSAPQDAINIAQTVEKTEDNVEIAVRVSVSHPQRLAKGFSSQILVNLYLPQFRAAVRKRVREGFEDDPIERRFDASLPEEADVLVGLSSPDITITEPVITTIRGGDVSIAFIAKPNDECRHGKHYVKFFIQDPDTKKEFLSTTFPLVVTDFVVDHLSQPFMSKLSAAGLTVASISMFALTFFQQVDSTFGLASGTASAAFAAVILARFNYIFRRSVQQEVSI